MAAAEARAFWQRTANRYFVQEDAKRAPKLACCQSTTNYTKQVDSGTADTRDHSSGISVPLNQNPMFTNLPPDSRWWLRLQPENVCQKGFKQERAKATEAEMEAHSKNNEIPGELDSLESTSCEFQGSIESKACENAPEFIDLMDTMENYGFMGLDMHPSGYPASVKPYNSSFDLDKSQWISTEKSEPWWRTTDKDNLASFVSRKSLEYIENCDLPKPQKLHSRKIPPSGNSTYAGEFLPFERRSRASCVSNPTSFVDERNFCAAVRTIGSQRASSMDMHRGSDESSSTNNKESSAGAPSENDFSKAQLLEALCHSQTRAREAEKAAKEACAEKDHIAKLLLKQAWQLFAYKQWFQLLRLEALYLRMKNAERPVSSVCSEAIVGSSGRPRKSKRVMKQGRGRSPGVAEYCVAFALGLSLVGGLLLGWTVGWMLPF